MDYKSALSYEQDSRSALMKDKSGVTVDFVITAAAIDPSFDREGSVGQTWYYYCPLQ